MRSALSAPLASSLGVDLEGADRLVFCLGYDKKMSRSILLF